ncbi:MAG: PASTA domain-containing protein [Armatimonadota bacterium]|nr:PASTA domain-containing protein [Armatimonadota bacterium]
MIDVLGWPLDEARQALEAAGLRVEVVETRTPRPVRLSGALRVVRQRQATDGLVSLVATRERYEPVPRTESPQAPAGPRGRMPRRSGD